MRSAEEHLSRVGSRGGAALWRLGLLGVLVLALGLRVWGIAFGMPYDTHPDEPAYVVSALKIANGQLRLDYPLMSPSLDQLMLVGEYGLLFLGGRLLGVYGSPAEFAQTYLVDATPFYVLARLASVLLSVLTMLLTYALGQKLVGRRGGLFAALFLAVAFVDVRHAHFAEPYALISLLGVSCVLTALLYARNGKVRWLLASAASAGAAFGLRYSMAPVLLVPPVAALLCLRRVASPAPAANAVRRAILAIVLGAVVGFVVGYPGIVLNPQGFLSGLKYYVPYTRAGAGFQGLVMNQGSGWSFYASVLPYGLGWPFLIACLAGIVLVLAKGPREWLIVLVFPAGFLLVIGMSSMAFVRYSVPLMPFAALLAGLAVDRLVGLAGERAGRAGAVAAAALACAVVIAPSLRNDVLHNVLLSREDTRTIAKRWIEANIPAGSNIGVEWFGPPLASESDPKPRSQRIYRKELLKSFSVDPSDFSLASYQKRGLDYLVVSSFVYEWPRTNPGLQAAMERFYTGLDTEAKLVAEFRPYSGQEAPPFFFEQPSGPITDMDRFERPGPTIKVYKLR